MSDIKIALLIFFIYNYSMRIESVQNKKIKEFVKLHTKKGRDEKNLFIVEGHHLIQEALQSSCLKELFILETVQNPFSFPAIECTQSVINKLSSQISNAKMIGVCEKQKNSEKKKKKVIFLDEIQDPGNMGTIIRTAHSFGIEAIYCSKNCVDVYNPKTVQASQGALFHIPVYYCDLYQMVSSYRKDNMKIFATALHQKSIFLQDVSIPDCYGIVFGNEGSGIHQELIEQCDECIKIEMATFESLNVAIAASICMYTFQYQKR